MRNLGKTGVNENVGTGKGVHIVAGTEGRVGVGVGVSVGVVVGGAATGDAAAVGAAVGAGGGVPVSVMRPSTLGLTGAFKNLM